MGRIWVLACEYRYAHANRFTSFRGGAFGLGRGE